MTKPDLRIEGGASLDLLERFFEETFMLDARGRICARCTPSSEPKQGGFEWSLAGTLPPEVLPRFVFGRTSTGNVWRFREGLDETTVRDLSRLAGRESRLPVVPDEAPPPERLENWLDVLRRGDPESRVLRALLHAENENGSVCADLYFFP